MFVLGEPGFAGMYPQLGMSVYQAVNECSPAPLQTADQDQWGNFRFCHVDAPFINILGGIPGINEALYMKTAGIAIAGHFWYNKPSTRKNVT